MENQLAVVNETALPVRSASEQTEIETKVSVTDTPANVKSLNLIRNQALLRRLNKVDVRAYDWTDVGDKNFFVELAYPIVRYNVNSKKWMLFQGHYWREDNSGEIMTIAEHASELRIKYAKNVKNFTEADGTINYKRRDAAIGYAYKCQSRHKLESMIKLAATNPLIVTEEKDWNANPDLLATPNGVIDLRTGKLRDGKPSDMLSRAIPVKYDPSAKCPRWCQFLNEVLEGPEEVREMQKFLGYCLTGHTTEQVVAFLQGNGSNGKSKLITVVTEILGWDDGGYSWRMDMACLNESSQNNIPNDLAALVGKRIAIAAEARPNGRIDVAKVKMLSGEDVVPGRRLYCEHFNFRPSAKIVLNVNHLPTANDTSNGYWRRALCWSFLRNFEAPGSGKDKNLSDKLREEYSGILNWLLEGVALWRKEGLKPTPKMVEMTRQYREANDSIGNFANDCLIFAPGKKVSIKELNERIKEWQEDEGESFKKAKLKTYLVQQGCQEYRVGTVRYWTNLQLKDVLSPSAVDPMVA